MISPSNNDANITIRRSFHVDCQNSLETFTLRDLRLDPENTLDWPEDVEKARIEELFRISTEFQKYFGQILRK